MNHKIDCDENCLICLLLWITIHWGNSYKWNDYKNHDRNHVCYKNGIQDKLFNRTDGKNFKVVGQNSYEKSILAKNQKSGINRFLKPKRARFDSFQNTREMHFSLFCPLFPLALLKHFNNIGAWNTLLFSNMFWKYQW